MKRGIVYFNKGSKCCIRLTVSLSTLRESGYDGPVAVAAVGKQPDWFLAELKALGADVVQAPDAWDNDYPLATKTRLWRMNRFDTSLFIDADTAVVRNPAELFPLIEEHGFAVTKFSNWITTGRIIAGRIEQWRHRVGDKITDDAIGYGIALNTGVFGWCRDHPMLAAWEDLAVNAQGDDKIMQRVLDEVACQVLAPQYKHTALDARWNYSVKHMPASIPVAEAGIIHYHGGKHCLPDNPNCEHWRAAYWRRRHASHNHLAMGDPQGDRRLNEYELPRTREDITITTCCTEQYVPKLTRCLPRLMAMPGLREQRWMMFIVDGDGSKLPAWSKPLRDRWPSIEFVPCPARGASLREAAFSTFIFDVAKHVKTPYHMKLDADSEPVDGKDFKWPDYKKYTITADPWGYSKVKGDDNAPRHWLKTLDLWWAQQDDIPEESRLPMFDHIPDGERRYSHDRIRSYCYIAPTAFAASLANRCEGERLPVPSHDTVSWYYATRANQPINRHKFRGYINA